MHRPSMRRALAGFALAFGLIVVALPCVEDIAGVDRTGALGAPQAATREPPPRTATTFILGRSVEGRPITATELGGPLSPHKVLVVGCIHGDECAGIRIARILAAMSPPANVDLWIVPNLNPDGYAAGTRGNSRGVDLNRNFPCRWNADPRGSLTYSGPTALSEPESGIAYSLIRRLQPRVTIWFHQSLGLVDGSGGSAATARRYARLIGLPLEELRRYPGSATTWQIHALADASAFVVELRAGSLSAVQAERYAGAILELARVGPSPVGTVPSSSPVP